MDEPGRLELHVGESSICELLEVVRDHHDTMPGPSRDRPGTDRIRVRTASGKIAVADVWSASGQDISAASGSIELFEAELIRWRECAAANDEQPDDASLQLVG